MLRFKRILAGGLDAHAMACSAAIVILAVAAILASDFLIRDEGVFASKAAIAVLIAGCVAGFVVCYIVIGSLYNRIDSATFEQEIHSLDYRNLVSYAIIIIMLWLPYYIIRFPGNVDTDTIMQLLQPYGLRDPSNHHPWFDTLIF